MAVLVPRSLAAREHVATTSELPLVFASSKLSNERPEDEECLRCIEATVFLKGHRLTNKNCLAK